MNDSNYRVKMKMRELFYFVCGCCNFETDLLSDQIETAECGSCGTENTIIK